MLPSSFTIQSVFFYLHSSTKVTSVEIRITGDSSSSDCENDTQEEENYGEGTSSDSDGTDEDLHDENYLDDTASDLSIPDPLP